VAHLHAAQGRGAVQPVLSTAAGAKRVSVGVRRWGNLRGLSQARRRTLAADDRPARLDHQASIGQRHYRPGG
jgi:hypothetical protein